MDEAASKCPHCQAYQRWYGNPQWIPLLFLVPLLLLTFRHSPYSVPAARFSDYAQKIVVSVVRAEPPAASASVKRVLLTVRLENQTDKKWQRPHFQIESLDSAGAILAVEHLEDASLVLPPTASAMDTLSLRVTPAEPVARYKVTITDLVSDRF
jgi:hypothetical protein